MSIDIFGLFKRQSSFTDRPPERAVLVIPIHEQVDRADVQPILEAAAAQIAKSDLVWRWQNYDGSSALCSWDNSQLIFLRGGLVDWQVFFGRHFIVKDDAGREFLGPSPTVCDRLLQRVLGHPELPVASWSLQLAKKREASK